MKQFTEEDIVKLNRLLPEEVSGYYRRLGEITMRKRISDDQWEAEADKIKEDTDKLVSDIHQRLAQVDGSYNFGCERHGYE